MASCGLYVLCSPSLLICCLLRSRHRTVFKVSCRLNSAFYGSFLVYNSEGPSEILKYDCIWLYHTCLRRLISCRVLAKLMSKQFRDDLPCLQYRFICCLGSVLIARQTLNTSSEVRKPILRETETL